MLRICTLGKFSIIDDELEVCLDDDALRSDMLKKLITYLVSHKERPNTVQELSDALWQEDETDNPTGALKNLMYRLRTVLKKYFGDKDFVITSHGAYSWNPEIATALDAEAFESLIKKAKTVEDTNEVVSLYEEAIDMYCGDFLENCADKHWMVTAATYYHSMYLTAVKKLASLYFKSERYADMERICTNALRFDNVDEQIYCDLIRSLIKQQKNDLAIKNFESAQKTLQEALGVTNPRKLAEVQKELLKMDKGSVVEKMQDIHEDMQEETEPEGVFLCGYPVFREIYRLEARKMSRLGEAEYVLLLTAKLCDDVDDSNEQMNRFLIKQAMGQIEKTLKRTLRIGDVAAKYSDSQYIILLPTCTYESTVAVSQRIIAGFKGLQKSKKVFIKTDMEQVTESSTSLVK